MKTIVKKTFIALLVGVLSSTLLAQEKTQAYYNTHESEILPDARTAFQRGNYERAVELCRWHYIIVGNQDAESLRNMAERCARLSEEMVNQKIAGKMKEAEEAANTLLSINPNDSAAKQLIEEMTQPETPLPQDTVTVAIPPIEETDVQETITNLESIPTEDQRIVEKPVQETPITPVAPVEPRTMFVLKAGATVLNLSSFSESIAPGGSLGLYDIGGSRIGLEAGGYICPNLMSTGSLFGVDASVVLRAAKSVYPKVGVGYFSYTGKTDNGSSTHGLCAGAGLTFMLGHFCLEIGSKYYPEICVQGVETVATTPGATYEFPSVKQILSGGIAPFVSIGFAF